jgi:hypothetical protein
MMTRIFLMLALGAASSALPAAPLPQIRQGLVKPMWVTALPQQEGRVYAVGIAPFGSGEAQALKQAASNARAEVLTRLRASVKSETNIRTSATVTQEAGKKATGSSQQQVGQDTRIQASATELPGLVVEETWGDAATGTAYALAYLDVPVAERELRTRFTTLKADLFQEGETPAAPRERMRMLNRLKGAQTELAKLDDMAALLAAGGGDPQLRSQVRAGKLSVDRQLDQLRGSLTLCLSPEARNATAVASILRNAALKAGLGWVDKDGEFTLVMNYRTENKNATIDVQRSHWNGWWWGGWVSHTVTKDTGILVARGALEISLQDKAGTPYESVEIEAKGVGTSELQAEQRLKRDFQEKLEKTFSRWLESLVK